ncbi:MerR family transcriptional regulator [Herbiconiux sp. YIM B11900]|uniref:MerR family transcriptional regulator n=1 Tax=Herbiconiux sp. YIM B11900 TaxID=3404131 RepID=UPI003F86B439
MHTTRDWPIQEVARLTGVTSRTLRHYAQLGLVEPVRVGANGYRYYDQAALVRLQRVLLLRELGLGVPAIAEVLENSTDVPAALRRHLELLRAEQHRLGRQIASVQHTIETMEGGDDLMADTMFDGFDHTAHREEVTERWGADAYASSDAWWRAKSPAEKARWTDRLAALQRDWREAAARGSDPAGDEAQALAQRQYDWLAGVPGTPAAPTGGPAKDYFVGLGDLYAADERFAAHYGGLTGGAFVRDALAAYAAARLA